MGWKTYYRKLWLFGKHLGQKKIKYQNGIRMIKFCIGNQLLIESTFFFYKQVQQITSAAEEINIKNTVDCFIFSNNTQYAIQDVGVFKHIKNYQ